MPPREFYRRDLGGAFGAETVPSKMRGEICSGGEAPYSCNTSEILRVLKENLSSADDTARIPLRESSCGILIFVTADEVL